MPGCVGLHVTVQVEGAWDKDGRTPSVWDAFSHIPGKIKNNDNGISVLVVLPASATRAVSRSPGLTLQLNSAELYATVYYVCQHGMHVQHAWHPFA
jgi:hypothetical protein